MKICMLSLIIVFTSACQTAGNKRETDIINVLKQDIKLKKEIIIENERTLTYYLDRPLQFDYVKVLFNIQQNTIKYADSFCLHLNNQCIMDTMQLAFLRISKYHSSKHPNSIPAALNTNVLEDSIDLYLTKNIYLNRAIMLQNQIIECMPIRCN